MRDVVDYEANNNNDSDVTYQRLLYVQEQLNTSLEQLENMVSKHYIHCNHTHIQRYLHFSKLVANHLIRVYLVKDNITTQLTIILQYVHIKMLSNVR